MTERPRVAEIRFYAELNDFLPGGQRYRDLRHAFHGCPAVKDVIESFGVPHPEVDLILVNGESVPFSRRLGEGDRVAVYPVFEGLDITPLVRLREKPLRDLRFVADGHLGKLARRLRMLGFDVDYRNDFEDLEIVRRSVAQRRVILTRDLGLLKHAAVTHGYWVRSTRPVEQVREVLRRFDLRRQARPFTRCTACNGDILPVERAEVEHRLEPLTRRHYDRFLRCAGCGRVYWEGSHFRRMRALVDEAVAETEPGPDPLDSRGA